MDTSLISLMIQIPIVGLFVWFTLKVLSETRSEREALATRLSERERRESETDTANRKYSEESLSALVSGWQKFSDERDDQWREFLIAEREARVVGLANMAAKIEMLALQIKAIQESLISILIDKK